MHYQSIHAIRAAKNVRGWGLAAAVGYCRKRNIPLSLFTLARQLETVTGGDMCAWHGEWNKRK